VTTTGTSDGSDRRMTCAHGFADKRSYPKRSDAVQRGEHHARHKLTERQVVEIITALQDKDVSKRGLAKIFGVSQKTIQNISDGTAWAHVHRPTT